MKNQIKAFQLILLFAFAIFLFSSAAAQINTVKNGGFETADMPAYWHTEDASDAEVIWAADEFRSPERSLKISETAGADAPAWVSGNLAKLNWNPTTGIPANAEMEIGGWVKTSNVNINPANADAEIQLIYTFYDNTGAMIFGQPVVIKVPQTAATADWIEIKNDSPVVLPTDADSMIISFKFGANATGTVWLDDIFMKTAPGVSAWLGDIFNANFGVPEGWFFWKDKMSEGESDYGTSPLPTNTLIMAAILCWLPMMPAIRLK